MTLDPLVQEANQFAKDVAERVAKANKELAMIRRKVQQEALKDPRIIEAEAAFHQARQDLTDAIAQVQAAMNR